MSNDIFLEVAMHLQRAKVGRTAIALVCMSVTILLCAKFVVAEGSTEQKASVTAPINSSRTQEIKYQLVNVNIPADSPLRNDENINKPPQLFIRIKRNGTQIGDDSTYDRGWSVDLQQNEERDINVWKVRGGTKDRYTVEVWDRNWRLWRWYNHLIFNVTGLSVTDFDAPIVESGSKLVAVDRLATIRFERLEDPAKEAKGNDTVTKPLVEQ